MASAVAVVLIAGRRVYNVPVSDPGVVACAQCDLVQRLPDLREGDVARCGRCDMVLWRRGEAQGERTLALGLAAAILYAIANTVPMLGLSAVGHAASTTVLGGAIQLWTDGRETVALLVLFTAVVAPALQIAFVLGIALATRRPPAPRWVARLLRHHPTASTWSMIEVMLLGVFVALIKIADYATVIPGVALFALIALVFLLAMIEARFDRRAAWARVQWVAARDGGAA